MTFIQLVDYETMRYGEVNRLFDEWLRATQGKRTTTDLMQCQDRDNPNHFVEIVEFPDYNTAMRNSDLLETKQIAERMSQLCSRPTRYVNLEVIRHE
ncbi:hypothetical protein C3Y87_06815 [Carbonactinospora thermoautotrophica]|uniref:Uncharacterized protein n=1 Tax=Carbonactinospora thermoautotrophica TaxID=1469144 RepID=A0A132MPW5_9ACTN|nr:hypothetical protein [Carbonactinospora thermoautotrophica]KWW99888.1 hypothetical protein LI90_1528 [Carbonactinospora thermoautotrophica]KWX04404.1 hypothetical protein TH66_07340 [Carbonactinospora thermoautotrophica]KWX06445.1 hypothetical protein TR74_21995 [Carbonactinospora thermoautotrophica]MCX9191127.1 hypothetical protein [Carbonactinospora thermoautotrophica]